MNDNLFKKKWIFLIIFIFIIILITIILLIIYLKPSPSSVPSSDIKLVDAWFFYTRDSNGGTQGRDILGNCYNEKGEKVEKGLVTDPSVNDDLELYLLTYAAGHEYYSSVKTSWGKLIGSSWEKYTKSVGKMLSLSDSDKVLVIDDSYGGPVVINQSCTLKGLVIRHAGILFFGDSQDITLTLEFILVESGGLLQAGSSTNPQYRYQHRLHFAFTNPPKGMIDMGSISSQYSYHVYFPGVLIPNNASDPIRMSAFDGNSANFCNSFSAKVFAVGFNGNVELSSVVPDLLPYQGNWTATREDDSIFLNPSEFSIPDRSLNIETEYSNLWVRMAEGNYGPGTDQNTQRIQIDPRDRQGIQSGWKKEDEIVITCQTEMFTSSTDPVGMVPLWLNHPFGSIDRKENEQANQEFISDKKTCMIHQKFPVGVEVATIQEISSDGWIYLKEPLQFLHISKKTELTDIQNNKIRVDSNLHVCLLTRNIKIYSIFEPNSSTMKESDRRCNILGKDLPADKKGVMGPTWCTYAVTSDQKNGEVFDLCYQPRTTEDINQIFKQYCGDEKPLSPQKGHWIFGTSAISGCNAIQGAHTMFMNGSSVLWDGVELKYMGTPANFGSIARYSIHFHMTGFSQSFREYLPSKDFSRNASIKNCSIWCSFSRWIVTHGSHQVNIKNNIGFIAYGSGYFIEDGTETNNTFEHNVGIASLSVNKNDYWNPIPIYPNVASDIAVSATFWFKNNQNRCFRNLTCCSPSPVIGFWAVPQRISTLRGPSTVCLGNPSLKLPAMATYWNAMGDLSTQSYLSQNKTTNNPNDPQRIYPDWKTACYMPEEMIEKLGLGGITQKCVNFTGNNCENPYLGWFENICYCMWGCFSEFPEAIGIPVGDVRGCGAFGTSNSINIHAFPSSPNPQFFPGNGQNSCTDTISQCTYFETIWGGTNSSEYPYQPLSKEEIDQYRNSRDAVVGIDQTTVLIPKIFSGWFTVNLGPNAGNLWGGAGWSKATPTWLLYCCFLWNGGGTASTNPNMGANCSDNVSVGIYDAKSSSVWASVSGNANQYFPNSYYVLYNIISNGWIGLAPNVTLWSGESNFLDKEVSPAVIEYVSNAVGINRFYLDSSTLQFPSTFWDVLRTQVQNLEIIDIRKNIHRYGNRDHPFIEITNESWESENPSNKWPYVCDDSGQLRKMKEPNTIQRPEWRGVTVNSQTGSFLNSVGDQIGNQLCQLFHKIPGCKGPYFSNPGIQCFCSQGITDCPPRKEYYNYKYTHKDQKYNH